MVLWVLITVLAFRAFGGAFPYAIPNFSPLIACCLLAGSLWSRERLLSATLCLSLFLYPLPDAWTCLTYALMIAIGTVTPFRLPSLLVGSLGAAITFHLITCSIAWNSPLYQPTLHGLWQSCWSGPDGAILPSWAFLRNSMTSTALFTGIIYILISNRVITTDERQKSALDEGTA